MTKRGKLKQLAFILLPKNSAPQPCHAQFDGMCKRARGDLKRPTGAYLA
jgi:hypothetical protein